MRDDERRSSSSTVDSFGWIQRSYFAGRNDSLNAVGFCRGGRALAEMRIEVLCIFAPFFFLFLFLFKNLLEFPWWAYVVMLFVLIYKGLLFYFTFSILIYFIFEHKIFIDVF